MSTQGQGGDDWQPSIGPRIYRCPRDVVEHAANALQRWSVPHLCNEDGDGYPLLDHLSTDPNDKTIASGREACGELAATALEAAVIWLRSDMLQRGSIAQEHRASVAEYFRQHFDYREPTPPTSTGGDNG